MTKVGLTTHVVPVTISKIEKFTHAEILAEQDKFFRSKMDYATKTSPILALHTSGMQSLNIQKCDLKEMSRSLKHKMKDSDAAIAKEEGPHPLRLAMTEQNWLC